MNDQSRRFHTQPETADTEFSAESAKTENRVDQPAPLDMESPQSHGGPTESHKLSPGGQFVGQNQNDSTDHDQQTTSEKNLGQDCKKKKRRGPKRKVANKPSQETEDTPDSTQTNGKETKLRAEKVTSGNNVTTTHTHAHDAGHAWATQDDIGQCMPSRYNLRNAGTPVSYARFFGEMDSEEW